LEIYAIDFPDTTGTGFVPVGHVKAEYFGIPGRVAPMAGLNSTVKPDGSFDMGIDTGTEFLQSVCNNNEIKNTVTITVTEKDASKNVIGSAHWCANGNGGMPGLTIINAALQLNSRDHSSKENRAASLSLRGRTWCSL
jgi:hypothetical protein